MGNKGIAKKILCVATSIGMLVSMLPTSVVDVFFLLRHSQLWNCSCYWSEFFLDGFLPWFLWVNLIPLSQPIYMYLIPKHCHRNCSFSLIIFKRDCFTMTKARSVRIWPLITDQILMFPFHTNAGQSTIIIYFAIHITPPWHQY